MSMQVINTLKFHPCHLLTPPTPDHTLTSNPAPDQRLDLLPVLCSSFLLWGFLVGLLIEVLGFEFLRTVTSWSSGFRDGLGGFQYSGLQHLRLDYWGIPIITW